MPAPDAASPDPDALLLVGRIVREHGVRGELKVAPETDDPARFDDLEVVYLGATAARVKPHTVRSVRYQPTKRGRLVVLAIEGVDTREAAYALRQSLVFADVADLPPLEEDEVFVHDLIGLRVRTEAGEEVGVVEDVLDTPAHLTLRIARPGRPDALVPAVPAFVAETDLDAGVLVLTPIEGLLE